MNIGTFSSVDFEEGDTVELIASSTGDPTCLRISSGDDEWYDHHPVYLNFPAGTTLKAIQARISLCRQLRDAMDDVLHRDLEMRDRLYTTP